MEEELAEVGEMVLYTGDTSHSLDDATIEVMKKYLIKGKLYKVTHITRYNPFNMFYSWHYQFECFGIFCYWFPCKSFTKKSMREIVTDKYGLK